MIDRLRSVVSVVRPRSLAGFLSRDSGAEGSVDDSPDEPMSRDRVWTPEEHVLELLDANGGRMWQQGIVSETGYSEAKVSRLLIDLEEDDIVDRHWCRGQKVVVLDRDPGEAVPSESGSPALVRR